MTGHGTDDRGMGERPTIEGTLDPNYEGGYRGMRMQGGRGRAPYGLLRALRTQDLETEGGFGGIHGPPQADSLLPLGGPEGGGLRDPFRDPEFIRDFNSLSPRYRDDRMLEANSGNRSTELERVSDRDVPRRSYDGSYTNRGIAEAGYSEGWARGPMRGAR